MEEYKIPDSETELGHFFDHEREKSIALMMSRFALSEDDAEEIYQNACLALFEKIRRKKLVKLTVPLTAYFYKIYINLSLKFLRNNHIIVPFDDLPSYDPDRLEELIGLDEDSSEHKYELIRKFVKDLPEPCETILWSFYESGLSMSDIASLLGYKNASVAKTKKSWCMSNLKNRIDKSVFYEYY